MGKRVDKEEEEETPPPLPYVCARVRRGRRVMPLTTDKNFCCKREICGGEGENKNGRGRNEGARG